MCALEKNQSRATTHEELGKTHKPHPHTEQPQRQRIPRATTEPRSHGTQQETQVLNSRTATHTPPGDPPRTSKVQHINPAPGTDNARAHRPTRRTAGTIKRKTEAQRTERTKKQRQATINRQRSGEQQVEQAHTRPTQTNTEQSQPNMEKQSKPTTRTPPLHYERPPMGGRLVHGVEQKKRRLLSLLKRDIDKIQHPGACEKNQNTQTTNKEKEELATTTQPQHTTGPPSTLQRQPPTNKQREYKRATTASRPRADADISNSNITGALDTAAIATGRTGKQQRQTSRNATPTLHQMDLPRDREPGHQNPPESVGTTSSGERTWGSGRKKTRNAPTPRIDTPNPLKGP
ncbi:unnamed protein product [Bemisia tabaci]|uniref:Uncharacterized protein n=1 Tax=Bemisia tabaci TaxID=7038 RepID=A0A9P0EWQ9_BEMTA|nr:unnamed protein product [Bemisia tabaci]